MANFKHSSVFQGLGIAPAVVVPSAAIYAVDCKLSLPSIAQGSSVNSAVVTLIKKNGSTVYTGSAGRRGAYAEIACAASDSLTVVLSSAVGEDNALNSVKTNIAISLKE